VGDPKQLPVLTLSGSSSNNAFEQSLFERLQSLNHPTILLRTQYRMHEDIAAFPSDQFYDGKLKTPDSVKERPTPLWSCPCFPTICFWDINRRNMSSATNGRGFSNGDEASFISQTILSSFVQNFMNRSDIITVGIISFYNDQVSC
jgi:senataxin